MQGLRKVALWSDVPVPLYFAARGVRQIVDGDQSVAANGGMLLISGVHVALGAWLEGLRPGRVVLEAMASGLPVVASRSGGYAEQMENGVDGVIVQTQEQAFQALRLLADQPDIRHQLGTAARNRAIALHGPQAVARLVRNYCA